MRVIINLQSNRLAGIAGWRARAVQINGKSETNLEEVLKTVVFEDDTSLYNIIIDKDFLKNDWILMANGIRMHSFFLKTIVKDNVQIHIIDKHRI